MTSQSALGLQVYSVKLSLQNGRSITFPVTLLTAQQADSIGVDLRNVARQSGVGEVQIELSQITLDDHDRILNEAQTFFNDAGQPKPLPAVLVAVQCSSCQAVMPLSEALDSSERLSDFMVGDPLPGDSRCDNCSRHSIENCYECRSEWVISNDRSFNFLCVRCQKPAGE
jgi:hypothetical protein